MNKKENVLLTVRDLNITYYSRGKSFHAVKNVNFNVLHGEVLGIVGESGSGKTTIGRSIVGINKDIKGQVYLGDKLVAGKETNLKKVNKEIIREIDDVHVVIKLIQKYLVKSTEKIIYVNNNDKMSDEAKVKSVKSTVKYLFNFAKDLILRVNYLIEVLESLHRYIDAANEFNENIKESDRIYYTNKLTDVINETRKTKLIINEIYVNALDIKKAISKSAKDVQSNTDILQTIAKSLLKINDKVNEFENIKFNLFGMYEANLWLLSDVKTRSNLKDKWTKCVNKQKDKDGTVKRRYEKFNIALEIINNFDDNVDNLWEAAKNAFVAKKLEDKISDDKLIQSLNNPNLSETEKEAIKEEVEELKLNHIKSTKDKNIHKLIQMIYQDPGSSLNEKMSIREILIEGIENYPELYKNKGVYKAAVRYYNNIKNESDEEYTYDDITPKMALDYLIYKIIDRVNLLPEHLSRYPHEFSGGQRQRIGICRSLIMKPKLIIADEPISALDVSIRAQVLNLLKKFKDEHDLTYIFIAHDLSLMKFVADRVIVLYKGEIVESGDAVELFNNPIHPYTKALLTAIPLPNPDIKIIDREVIEYDKEKEHYDYLLNPPKFVEVIKDHFVLCNERELKVYKKEQKGS